MLLATGGVATVAGCFSTDGTEQADATADFVDSNVLTAPPRDGSTDTSWLRIDIENDTSAPHGRLEAESRVRSEDGTTMVTGEHVTSYLPANTTLRYFVDAEFEVDAVDAVENDVVEANTRVESTQLDDVTVRNTDLSAGGDVLNVTGEFSVGVDEAERLVVVALIYDEAGRLRGTGTDIKYTLDTTEPVEFGANSDGFRAPAGSTPLESYDVVVFDGYT
ncbi:hypothetical protein C490_17192 [Natronobacterium gregoryi SP2]|nr:hypothetical protein C490_17192 [Natronobacterium gregoryi SP2]